MMKHPRFADQGTANRKRYLARIHQAKKALALDDDIYRAVLQRVTGKSSAADMCEPEFKAVLAEFVRLGTPQPHYPGRPKDTNSVPMLRKVEALLAQAKRPWNYAHAMARHMFGSDRLEFLHEDQLHKIIQALEVDARRHAQRKPASSRKTHP